MCARGLGNLHCSAVQLAAHHWQFTPAAIAIITIALVGTALGTITPILRDAGLNKGPIGTAISAAGAIGEFGPLVAITIFLGSNSPTLPSATLQCLQVSLPSHSSGRHIANARD